MSSEKKRFATTGREEVPFDLEREAPDKSRYVEDYILVPASSLATRRFREASLSGAEMEVTGDDENRKNIFRKLGGLAGSQTRLVADCCYKILKDGGREGPMEQQFVEDIFPGDLTEWAFTEVKRISPWLDERGDGKEIERLEARIKADQERLARLKAADPKAAPPRSMTSSTARGG